MSNMEVTRVLEWKSTDGLKKSLIVIVNKDKSPQDIDYRSMEVCSFDGEEWKTEEKVDFVKEITDYGIPQSLVD